VWCGQLHSTLHMLSACVVDEPLSWLVLASWAPTSKDMWTAWCDAVTVVFLQSALT
jgi:hypothetical protein